MTREEVESGDLKLTIDECGGPEGGTCIVTSAKKNAAFEGNADNKYKVVLTDVGVKELAKPQPPRRSGRTLFPVQHHVRLTLTINSDITDGVPKIPVVSAVSFGGLTVCKPKPTKVIKKPICPRKSVCPAGFVTPKEGGLTLTLPADKRRVVRFSVAFEDDATLNATVVSEKVKQLKHKERCGTLHSFILIRRFFTALRGKPVNISLDIAQNPVPTVSFFTSKSSHGSSCGFTCGQFKGCVKPEPIPGPVTTPAPAPTTTEAPAPAPTTTEAPAPAPATTEQPAPAPITTPIPDEPEEEPEDPDEPSDPETEAPAPAPEADAPESEEGAPEIVEDGSEPEEDAPESEEGAPEVVDDGSKPEEDAPKTDKEAPESEDDAPEIAENAPEIVKDVSAADNPSDDEIDADIDYDDDFDALIEEW